MTTTDKPTIPTPLMCSICGKPIPARGTWTRGNNAEPINSGRCCYVCEAEVVLPARLVAMRRSGEL